MFFPTEKETHFVFLVQGPYRTTPSRDNVPTDDSRDQKLIQRTAALLMRSIPDLARRLPPEATTLMALRRVRGREREKTRIGYPAIAQVDLGLVHESNESKGLVVSPRIGK
ncbi:hypothetical protein OAE37_00090 [Pirellulaceae bacterium]|nr:hypothetical protein [Pirellulaceae bacterium]